MSTAETFTVSQPRVAAGALFLDSSGQVLLVKPSYKPLWDIPGGYVEPGETPRQACVREVAEELGLARTIGRPLVIDWAPASGEGDKLLFVFEGGVLTREDLAKVSLQTEELEQVRFFSPASFAEVLTDPPQPTHRGRSACSEYRGYHLSRAIDAADQRLTEPQPVDDQGAGGGSDRGQSGVAGPGTVVPVGFEVIEERADDSGVEVFQPRRDGGLPVRCWAKSSSSRSVSR